jgi:hypothetical protein
VSYEFCWTLALLVVSVALGYCLRGLQEAFRDLREIRREQDRS